MNSLILVYLEAGLQLDKDSLACHPALSKIEFIFCVDKMCFFFSFFF